MMIRENGDGKTTNRCIIEDEFKKRVKSATMDNRGMICLGWNKIDPSSPFGKDLIEKYQLKNRVSERTKKLAIALEVGGNPEPWSLTSIKG